MNDEFEAARDGRSGSMKKAASSTPCPSHSLGEMLG
jgi:hypothetical protein